MHAVAAVDEVRTERLQEGAPVLLRQQAVEHEVSGGVDRHQKVEDVAEDAKQYAFIAVLIDVVERRVEQSDGCGQLADEEENDDSDQHHRYARLLRRARVPLGCEKKTECSALEAEMARE